MPRFNAQGTELQVEDPGSPGTFLTVGCLTSINGPTISVPEIDATCMTDTAKVYLPGLQDPGNISFEMQVDFQDANVQRLFTDIDARTVRTYRVAWSDNLAAGGPAAGTIFEFTAFITGLPTSGGVDAVVTATLDLRVTGPIAYTFGA